MKDLIEAKKYLSFGATIALVRENNVIISQKTGIASMMSFIVSNKQLAGYSVADKIVGKAAAMLFALAGINRVYAQVLSLTAKEYLQKKNILVEYNTLVDKIINRKGTGQCPMEECVKDIYDELIAYNALELKIQQLKGVKNERDF